MASIDWRRVAVADVDVVDRGSGEVIVFLSGEVEELAGERLTGAVEQAVTLRQVSDPERVIVDLREVTGGGEGMRRFLEDLHAAGVREGFTVDLANVPAAAEPVVTRLSWATFPDIERPPPRD
jgi:hypothetical protein